MPSQPGPIQIFSNKPGTHETANQALRRDPGHSGQSGVHHPLSPVIGLGLPNHRKKERKERTQMDPEVQ